MIEFANSFLMPLASWLITFFIHSTVLLGLALLSLKFLKPRISSAKVMILTLFITLLTTSLQLHFFPTDTVKYFGEDNRISTQIIRLKSETFPPTISDAKPLYLKNDNYRAKTPLLQIIQNLTVPLLIVAVWLAGMTLGSLNYIKKWLLFLAKISKRETITNGPLPEILAQLQNQFNFKRRVTLSYCSELDSPIALGNSEICLPKGICSRLSHDEITSILAHELAHLKRYDPAKVVLLQILGTIFFFQPLVTRLIRKITLEAEYKADEWAIAQTGNPLSLAKSLLYFANSKTTPRLATGASSGDFQLLSRVKRILNSRSNPGERSFFKAIWLPAFLIIMAMILTAFETSMRFQHFGDGQLVSVRSITENPNSEEEKAQFNREVEKFNKEAEKLEKMAASLPATGKTEAATTTPETSLTEPRPESRKTQESELTKPLKPTEITN